MRAFRQTMRLLIPLVCIPLTVLLGATVAHERQYLLVSFCVAALVIVLFLLGFEERTVLSAVYLGAESGFTVGALSALVSNFYFGQGPWTPFQMLAWGLIGLLAGWLASPLKRSRILLLVFGLLSGVAYSALMDIWTVFWANSTLTPSLYLAALLTALPHTLLYAVSNVLFLALLAKPFGEKLERIKLKYGV